MSEGGQTDIIKRTGRRLAEPFDRRKLEASIVAACLSARTPTGHAESLARRVTDEVIDWTKQHPEVTSQDLRRIAGQKLRVYQPDAAYLYEQHRTTL